MSAGPMTCELIFVLAGKTNIVIVIKPLLYIDISQFVITMEHIGHWVGLGA